MEIHPMKSPMLVRMGLDHGSSKLKILRSGAGFYIGTQSNRGEPMSRDSGYFATRAAAQSFLTAILALPADEAAGYLRQHP
jgi:hypothetical protein